MLALFLMCIAHSFPFAPSLCSRLSSHRSNSLNSSHQVSRWCRRNAKQRIATHYSNSQGTLVLDRTHEVAGAATDSAGQLRRSDKGRKPIGQDERRVTRSMSKGTRLRATVDLRATSVGGAKGAVLNTAELLENTLVHLPARTLFAVQRVSTQFHDAVRDSVQIQRKLFRRLRRDSAETWIAQTGFCNIDGRTVPYYLSAKHPTLREDSAARSLEPAIPRRKAQVVDSNTTLPYSRSRPDEVCIRFKLPTTVDLLLGDQGFSTSWQDTWVPDPPSYDAWIYFVWHIGAESEVGASNGVADFHMHDPAGLRLGGVMRYTLGVSGYADYDGHYEHTDDETDGLDVLGYDTGTLG